MTKSKQTVITQQWLKEQSACPEGIVWFIKQKETDGLAVVKKLIVEDKFDWANWLIVRVMSYKQYVSYGVYAAEQVIDIYEKKYPNDKRPRQAIEAAKKCIENPSKENKANAAYATAYAAYAAAYAANSANAAAYAANAAAYAAADAADAAYAATAAYAAYAANAAYATYAANAAYATYAAAYTMKKKILEYGIKLLDNEN